jgi:AcrR family transcriptional regulator
MSILTGANLPTGGGISTFSSPTDNPIAATNVERLLDRQRLAYAGEAQRLIRACRELIAETGSTDPPVSAILERAGLASRAFYRLFPSKDDLLVAVLLEGVLATVALTEKRQEGLRDPGARIEAWTRAMVERITGVPPTGRSSLLLQAYRWEAMFPPQIDAMRERLLAPLAEAIDELNPHHPLGAHDAALGIYDLVISAICRFLAHDTKPSEQVLRPLIDTVSYLANRRPSPQEEP